MTSTGLIVAAAVLVIGTAAGLWRRRVDGRLRSVGAARSGGLLRSGGAARSGGRLRALPPIAVGVAGDPAPGGITGPGIGAKGRGRTDHGAAGDEAADAGAGGSGATDAGAGDSGAVGSGATDAGAAGQRVDAELLTALGVGPAQATLLQFSSAFCAPCRAVRRVSSEVAALLPGVRHVEVDAESHLDAVRALGIWRTPTLLVLDADGRVAKRATGVPAKPQLIAVLGEILPAA